MVSPKPFRLGTYAGAPIWLTPEALVVYPLLVVPFALQNVVGAGVLLVALFVSILCHEVAHAYAARRCGLHVASIYLTGAGGICFFEDPARDVRRRCAVALAGPFANLAIALALGSASMFHAGHPQGATALSTIVTAAIVMNMSLFLGNLLPIIPLDGGQILFALLEARWATRSAALATSAIGIVVCVPATFIMIIFIWTGFPVVLPLALQMNWHLFKMAWADRPRRPAAGAANPIETANRLMAAILAEESRRNEARRQLSRRSTPPDLI